MNYSEPNIMYVSGGAELQQAWKDKNKKLFR